jgi:hypothetical protein
MSTLYSAAVAVAPSLCGTSQSPPPTPPPPPPHPPPGRHTFQNNEEPQAAHRGLPALTQRDRRAADPERTSDSTVSVCIFRNTTKPCGHAQIASRVQRGKVARGRPHKRSGSHWHGLVANVILAAWLGAPPLPPSESHTHPQSSYGKSGRHCALASLSLHSQVQVPHQEDEARQDVEDSQKQPPVAVLCTGRSSESNHEAYTSGDYGTRAPPSRRHDGVSTYECFGGRPAATA